MIELRTVGPDDWRMWRELRLAALTDAPEAFGSRLADWRDAAESRWRERLGGPGYHNVVAIVDGQPSGMASGIPGDAGTAELISMYVSPAARGVGVGDRLVADVITWARATGATELRLDVVAGNTPAADLYRRNGFHDTGERIPGPPPELRMALPLP